jgi:hypothetical protein
MEKSPKKKTAPIISTMPKKKTSDLDRAISYFKIKNTNIINQANQLGIKPPTMRLKKKDGTVEIKKVKPSNEPTSFYANKVREQIIKKWKTATQEYYGTYNMFFKVYDSKSKKLKDVVVKITSRGTKDSVLLNALAEYERRKKQYEDEYPENDSYEFAEDPISLIPITTGTGIVVENKRIETSVSGGQRIVGVRGNKRNMKMRDAFSFFKFSTTEDNEWDTKQGKCVFDYLYWKFNDVSGFKKKLGYGREKAEEFLNELFMSDEEDEENPLVQGVSVQQLECFCDYFNINMYAYDKGDDLIQAYKCKKVMGGGISGKGVLCFVVFDNHFYPVEADNEVRSKVARAYGEANKTNYTSNDIEIYNGNYQIKMRELIAPTQEEFEVLKGDNRDYLSVQNKFAFEWLRKNAGTIPFPISAKNIRVSEATLDRIIFDDKILLTRPINKYANQFYLKEYEGTDKLFQGEGTIDVMKYTWKQKYPFDIMTAPFYSQPNNQVADVLKQSGIKWRTHLGLTTDKYSPDEITEMLLSGKARAYDICKCYCDALYNQKERFIVFKGKEIMEAYDGKQLTLGLYFVETDDMTLLHQSNWYSSAIIKLAIEENIELKITRQIRCVDEEWNYCKVEEDAEGNETKRWELSNDKLFKDWIDEVVELTEQDEDFTLTKDVINSITGYLGKTSSVSKSVGLAKNNDEVYYDFIVPELENNPNAELYINEIKTEDDKMYLYGYETRTRKLSNGLPMYLQILDWSNMALYNLSKFVGGETIYRKTDCIVVIGGKDLQLEENKYYTDTFGKYRYEDTEKALLFNYFLTMNKNRHMETPKLDGEWIDYNFKSSEEWEGIIKTAIEKGGMLVSGRAGTGKSYIIGKGIEAGLLDEDPETRMSFTNRAARNIKGTTIHKNMAINCDDKTNNKTLTHLKKHKIFIIDEISMINSSLWNKLMVLKKTTGAIFILLGDYRQCPPIEEGRDTDYFTHPYAKALTNYNRCELTKPQRYDMKMWKWLEDFYEYGYAGDEIQKKKPSKENILTRRNIVYTNKTRTKINNFCMEESIKGKYAFVVLDAPNKCKNDKAEKAYIYAGLPIMAIANNKDFDIINSDEFIVDRYDLNNEIIYMKSLEVDREIEVPFKYFHNNFVVNYAATTHKSQGATITVGINVWDWFLMENQRKIGYTAISRAKTCDQVWICEWE